MATLGGNDTISLAELKQKVPLDIVIDAGADNDTIDARSYEGKLVLIGGQGEDEIHGGKAENWIFGGDDPGWLSDDKSTWGTKPYKDTDTAGDRLYVGDNQGHIYGGGGDDTLVYAPVAGSTDLILVYAGAFIAYKGDAGQPEKRSTNDFVATGIEQYQVDDSAAPNVWARAATTTDPAADNAAYGLYTGILVTRPMRADGVVERVHEAQAVAGEFNDTPVVAGDGSGRRIVVWQRARAVG